MSLRVQPLENVGVEVSGFDINQPFSATLKEELRALFYEHAILLFRNQHITPQNQIEFSRIFGPLEIHPLKATTNAENPELFELENGGDNDAFLTAFYHGEEIVGRLDWHMDLHYTGKPNHGAVLTAVQQNPPPNLTLRGVCCPRSTVTSRCSRQAVVVLLRKRQIRKL